MSRTPQEHDTHERLNRSRSGLVGMPAALLPGIVNTIAKKKRKYNIINNMLAVDHAAWCPWQSSNGQILFPFYPSTIYFGHSIRRTTSALRR